MGHSQEARKQLSAFEVTCPDSPDLPRLVLFSCDLLRSPPISCDLPRLASCRPQSARRPRRAAPAPWAARQLVETGQEKHPPWRLLEIRPFCRPGCCQAEATRALPATPLQPLRGSPWPPQPAPATDNDVLDFSAFFLVISSISLAKLKKIQTLAKNTDFLFKFWGVSRHLNYI